MAPPPFDPWQETPPPSAGPPPSAFMSSADFKAAMDGTFGPGKWADTGDYRSPQREDQLRAQGAGTVAPGHVSAHSQGTPDAPGAHDLVVPGMSTASAVRAIRASGLPIRQVLAEGAQGGQGAHLHTALAPGPNPWQETGPPTADPWKETAPPTEWKETPPPAPAVAGPGGAISRGPNAPADTGPRGEQINPFTDTFFRGGGYDPAHPTIVDRAVNTIGGMFGHKPGELQQTFTKNLDAGVAAVARGAGEMAGALPDDLTPMPGAPPPAPAAVAAERARIAAPTAAFAAPYQATADAQPTIKNPDLLLSATGAVAGALPFIASGPLAPAAMAASGFDQVKQDALAKGLPEGSPVADQAAATNALIQMGLGVIPVGALLDKIPPVLKQPVLDYLARIGVHAAGGAALGTAMQVATNATEQPFDPDKPLLANVPENAATMAAFLAMHALAPHARPPPLNLSFKSAEEAKAWVDANRPPPPEAGPATPPAGRPAAPVKPLHFPDALEDFIGDSAPPVTPEADPTAPPDFTPPGATSFAPPDPVAIKAKADASDTAAAAARAQGDLAGAVEHGAAATEARLEAKDPDSNSPNPGIAHEPVVVPPPIVKPEPAAKTPEGEPDFFAPPKPGLSDDPAKLPTVEDIAAETAKGEGPGHTPARPTWPPPRYGDTVHFTTQGQPRQGTVMGMFDGRHMVEQPGGFGTLHNADELTPGPHPEPSRVMVQQKPVETYSGGVTNTRFPNDVPLVPAEPEPAMPPHQAPRLAPERPAAPPPAPAAKPVLPEGFGADNKLAPQSAFEAAKARLLAKRRDAGGIVGDEGGAVDAQDLADGITMATYYLEGGVRSFSDYASHMIADLGEWSRPHLHSWYEAVRFHPGFQARGEMTPTNEITPEVIARAGREDGLQSPVPSGDAATRPEDVQRPDQERADERPPGSEGGRGGDLVQPTDGGRAPVEMGEHPQPERGGDSLGEGVRADAGLPGRPAGGTGDAGHPGEATGEVATPAAAPERPVDHVLAPGAVDEGRGWPQKARDNLRAIQIAKALKAERRQPTPEERDALAKYVGWGGMPGAFIHPQTGRYGKGFEQIGPALKETLTPEEYKTAERSTQYAHYTAENVIRAMWQAVQGMGFKGGDVFEPGAGVGHFRGMMPPELAGKARYRGVEMDGITAQIAKALYPKSGIVHADFTEKPLADHSFDLVIGNPPFGKTVIRSDPRYKANGFRLHNYFFAKSMDSLRPGGLLAFVTSAGSMNSVDAKAREYLAERAEFVGGVRLPSSAFRQNAGTEVTTDILFFKKRPADVPLKLANAEHWTDTTVRQLPDAFGGHEAGPVNRYFAEHPEQVLGREGFFDKLHAGRYAVHPEAGRDLTADLAGAMDRLPKDILADASGPRTSTLDSAPPETKQNSYYVHNGVLMQYRDGGGRPVPTSGEGRKLPADVVKIKHLVKIRDAYRNVLAADQAFDAEGSARHRVTLNAEYDAFVAQHGPINKQVITPRNMRALELEAARAEARDDAITSGLHWRDGSFDDPILDDPMVTTTDRANARKAAKARAAAMGRPWDEGSFDPEAQPQVEDIKRPNFTPFQADPESFRLSSLEKYNSSTHVATKGDGFFESQIGRETEPELNSANDGVLWSLNKLGRLDVDAIAEKMGRHRDDILQELGDSVYRVPDSDQYESADMYLSGDVLDKLDAAREAARSDPAMERNVAALEAHRPAPVPPGQIDMDLGMPWIPAKLVTEFARDELRIGDLAVSHNKGSGGWIVNSRRFGDNVEEHSTPKKKAFEVLSLALNRDKAEEKVPVVDADGKTRMVLDPDATQALQDKIANMRELWKRWLGEPQRVEPLAALYNNLKNRTTPRKVDGSYLTTPGIMKSWKWHDHQRSVVARIIQLGNTYMAHAVGAGKTAAMIGAGMEMKRLGLVQKPMYIVPNHMLNQFAGEFLHQYPLARIMVAGEQGFEGNVRKQFVSDGANQDLDAVIMTHSAFKLIPSRPETQAKVAQIELDRLLEAYGDGKSLDRFTKKDLEQKIEAMEERVAGRGGGKKDQTYFFEDLGVDHLFVDEAHLFRKLDYGTRHGDLKGVSKDGSDRAWDLYTKIHHLDEQNPGRSVVLASGTPVTNTLGELYTVSRFLQPGELDRQGIGHFDSWAATYAQLSTELEQQPDGSYKAMTRLGQIYNAPELFKMVGQIMDVVTGDQLGDLVTRPDHTRTLVQAPFSPWHQEFRDELADRARAIKGRKGKVPKGSDVLFSLINDGRASAIDPRMIDPRLPNDPDSKLNMMIAKVADIYHRTGDVEFHDPKDGYKTSLGRGPATQMIFSDLGVNPTKNRPFSAYAWMKKDLIARGVDPDHIAFMGDYDTPAKKQALFGDMNTGKKRILIGSVEKMGVGTNAHVRLIALHNLDPHWYPANDEQRVGRILRQGNTNRHVDIYDYATTGSYDSQMYGMMGRKGQMIERFFRGDPLLRHIEAMGEASMFAQVAGMTTSDPRVLELTELKEEIAKEERRQGAHEQDQYSLGDRLSDARRREQYHVDREARLAADIAQRVPTAGDAFSMQVVTHAEPFKKRAEAGAAIDAYRAAHGAALAKGEQNQVGTVGGFPLFLRRDLKNNLGYRLGLSTSGHYIEVGSAERSEDGKFLPASGASAIQGAETHLRNFERDQADALAGQQSAREQIAAVEPRIGLPYTGDLEAHRQNKNRAHDLQQEIEADEAATRANAESESAERRAGSNGLERMRLRKEAIANGDIRPHVPMRAAAPELPNARFLPPPVDFTADTARRELDHGLSGNRLNAGPPLDLIKPALRVFGHEARKFLGERGDQLGDAIKGLAEKYLPDAAKTTLSDVQMVFDPMRANSSDRAQAQATTFANTIRAITAGYGRVKDDIKSSFDQAARIRMGLALDRHGVAFQEQRNPGPEGLDGLTPEERATVLALHARRQRVFARARQVGMHDTEGLPFHFPRMAVDASGGQIRHVRPQGPKGQMDKAEYANVLNTTTGQMRHRKYLTIEDTEAAAKQAFGPGATIVRDILALPLAMERMERAIAGRTLINQIRKAGRDAATKLVSADPNDEPTEYQEGDEHKQPAEAGDNRYYTDPTQPAFTYWRVRLKKDADNPGKLKPVRDEFGNVIRDPQPIYILKEYQGPLNAVLKTDDHRLVSGFMTLKGKAMSVTMYTPLIHNQVVFAKAFPKMLMTGTLFPSFDFKRDGVGGFAFGAYRIGGNVRNDAVLMARAYKSGIVAPGKGGKYQDLLSIARNDELAPGQSWTAQLLSLAALGDKDRADAIKRGVDVAGDWWHNKFLWDRVADLQLGIWKATSDANVKKGMDQETADRVAAHAANQYAGSVPAEAMSRLSRGLLNGVLFSRSFHVTNLAGAKTIATGLPSNIQAQIRLSRGPAMVHAAQGEARANAVSVFVVDYLAARALRLLGAAAFAWLAHQAFQDPKDNERGKKTRVWVGQDSGGTNLYMRIPAGKYIEEFTDGWGDAPEYLKQIMFGPTRLANQYLNNDAGFGHKLYDDSSVGHTAMGRVSNAMRVAAAAAGSFIPIEQFEDLWGVAAAPSGAARKESALRFAGDLTGFTTSHGYPSGAVRGVLADVKSHHEDDVGQARRGFMTDLGSPDPATRQRGVREMNDANVPQDLQAWFTRAANGGTQELSGRDLVDFNKWASPEQKADMAKAQAQIVARIRARQLTPRPAYAPPGP